MVLVNIDFNSKNLNEKIYEVIKSVEKRNKCNWPLKLFGLDYEMTWNK